MAIVALAALAVVRRHAPSSLKRAARVMSAAMLRRCGWHAAALRMTRAAAADARCGDACGSCQGCGPRPAAHDDVRGQRVSLDALRSGARR